MPLLEALGHAQHVEHAARFWGGNNGPIRLPMSVDFCQFSKNVKKGQGSDGPDYYQRPAPRAVARVMSLSGVLSSANKSYTVVEGFIDPGERPL